MKIYIINTLALFILTALSLHISASDVVRLSEPVFTSDEVEVFGEEFTYDHQALGLSEIMKTPDSFLNSPLVMETTIKKVCQKKGCFFISQIEDQVVRVSFKDYGFFIPTDTASKNIKAKGELIKVTLSEERAEHYREDLGLTKKSINAGDAYEFVASAVAVYK